MVYALAMHRHRCSFAMYSKEYGPWITMATILHDNTMLLYESEVNRFDWLEHIICQQYIPIYLPTMILPQNEKKNLLHIYASILATTPKGYTASHMLNTENLHCSLRLQPPPRIHNSLCCPALNKLSYQRIQQLTYCETLCLICCPDLNNRLAGTVNR